MHVPQSCIHKYMQTYINAYKHTMLTYMHNYMHTYLYIHAYTHTCLVLHTYDACIYTYNTCIYTYIQTGIETYIHIQMLACLQYIHAYIHTYTHAYMYRCKHDCVYMRIFRDTCITELHDVRLLLGRHIFLLCFNAVHT